MNASARSIASRRDCLGYAAVAALVAGAAGCTVEQDEAQKKDALAQDEGEKKDPQLKPAEAEFNVIMTETSLDVYPMVTKAAFNEEGIIEPNTRQICNDVLQRPHAAVCKLTVKFRSGNVRHATGFFVNGRTIVTVAHALARPGAMNDDVLDVIVDANLSAASTHPPLPYDRNKVPAAWKTSNGTNFDYDYGVVKLRDLAPPRVKDLPMMNYPYVSTRFDAEICGYPVLGGNNKNQYNATEKCLNDLMAPGGKSVIHRIDTTSGQSGGPIMIEFAGADVAIGIHCGVLVVGVRNFGRRIDTEVVDFVNNA